MQTPLLDVGPDSLKPSGAQDRKAARAEGETLLAPGAAGFAARRVRVLAGLRLMHWTGALLLATLSASLMGLAGVLLDQSDGLPGAGGLWSVMMPPSAVAWLAVMGVFAAVAVLPAVSPRGRKIWVKAPRDRAV